MSGILSPIISTYASKRFNLDIRMDETSLFLPAWLQGAQVEWRVDGSPTGDTGLSTPIPDDGSIVEAIVGPAGDQIVSKRRLIVREDPVPDPDPEPEPEPEPVVTDITATQSGFMVNSLEDLPQVTVTPTTEGFTVNYA